MTIPMPIQENIRTMDADGVPARQIAKQLRVSRNTVAKYVGKTDFSPTPSTDLVASLVDDYANIIEGWLLDDLRQPRKQRHTGRRVYHRLVAEHEYSGSYSTVQRWVKRWREARVEAGAGYLELEWDPGSAQADFGVVDAVIQGERVTTHMLVVTWPYSNARYAVTLPGETAECVCDGLRTIFEHVGRVPHTIVFDNATGVGKRGRDGHVTTTTLFDAFKLHYRLAAVFTSPNAGNEKGSVENAVGYIRRNLLVPVPHVESMSGLTSVLLAGCDVLLAQPHYRKRVAIQALFSEDVESMRDLPGVGFDACTWYLRRVDNVGNVEVAGVKYYVGGQYHGQRIHVGARAFTVEARTLTGEPIVDHRRVYGSTGATIHKPSQLLAGLLRKPGGYRNSSFKTYLPDTLRNLFDEADNVERRRLLRMVEQVTGMVGFEQAVTVMGDIAATGRHIDYTEVEMVAKRAREEPSREDCVDLSVYDRFTNAGTV